MRESSRRLYLLDIARGIASLAVVVWHYQHFFFDRPGHLAAGFAKSSQPFYEVLWPLYEAGFHAVQVFFVLSGFIFFFNYYDAVRTGAVSAYAFAVLRFSRLYPLHLVTLIFVAALQYVAWADTGAFFVYPENGAGAFLLNLAFAQNWGFTSGYSFNGPTWSVSVEILLYVLFFVVALTTAKSLFVTGTLMVAGLAMAAATGTAAPLALREIGFAIYCFFGGGAACLVYRRLAGTKAAARLCAALLVLAVVATALVYRVAPGFVFQAVMYGAAFPALVLLLATLQDRGREVGRRFRIIGDITYSTYLLHFPIQLAIVALIARYGLKVEFTHPAVFLAFLGLVIGLAIPTFYRFERPLQTYLRRKLLSRRLVRVSPV